MSAIEHALASGVLTPDLGGEATTEDVTDGVIEGILSADTHFTPAGQAEQQ